MDDLNAGLLIVLYSDAYYLDVSVIQMFVIQMFVIQIFSYQAGPERGSSRLAAEQQQEAEESGNELK